MSTTAEPQPAPAPGFRPGEDRVLELDGAALAASLPGERRAAMREAGFEIVEISRVLNKTGANVVGEILRTSDAFVEWDHYPKGDIYDAETHSQYYYHAHSGEAAEHGHFHTFMRAKGMPDGVDAVEPPDDADWPLGDEALSHLIAISMDHHGLPRHLFTTNRWVTGETWYAADDVIAMLDGFAIDHSWPSWPANRWVTAMVALFRPQIETLLRERDRVIEAHRESLGRAGDDVFEDRGLEVTSICEISLLDQLEAVGAVA